MKRPAFQFYPDNWRNNANLRRCSWAARGVWIEVMCLMHDSDRYGVLDWPLKEIAQALGCPLSALRELVEKGVLKGCDKGVCEAFSYTPRSGRRDGAAVTLVEPQEGPLWFSSRMVKDEYLRDVRGEGSRFKGASSGSPDPSPKGGIGEGIGAAPLAGQSDGSPSPSPSPPLGKDKNPSPSLRSGEGSSPAPIGAGDPPADPPVQTPPAKVPRKRPEVPEKVLLEMAAVWNEIAAAGHGLPSVAELNERRRQQMRARCGERWTTDPVRQFRAYVRRICTSEFLTGGGPRGWKADFEWAIQPRNVLAVAEGKYHDGENG